VFREWVKYLWFITLDICNCLENNTHTFRFSIETTNRYTYYYSSSLRLHFTSPIATHSAVLFICTIARLFKYIINVRCGLYREHEESEVLMSFTWLNTCGPALAWLNTEIESRWAASMLWIGNNRGNRGATRVLCSHCGHARIKYQHPESVTLEFRCKSSVSPGGGSGYNLWTLVEESSATRGRLSKQCLSLSTMHTEKNTFCF
jgi:hypothetical protein